MHRTASLGSRLACLAVVLSTWLSPAQTPVAAQTSPPDHLDLLLFSPLVKIYQGDTVRIPFALADDATRSELPLAPLTPLDAAVQAALGSASVQADFSGGTILYQAENSGQEKLSLQVQNPLGSGTADLEFTVYPQPNYTLDFYLTGQDSGEAGSGFRALFSGSGKFSSTEDTPVNGSGEADFWLSLWAITQPFQCQLTPPVQGHGGFEIVPANEFSPVSLVQEPGYIDPVDLSLKFQPMSLNAATIECAGMGNISAHLPWPAQQANGDDLGLQNLHFPGEGGILPYQNGKTEGLIIVTRIQP